MRVHDLKVWPAPFRALRRGEKRHEVRRDDRGFAVGDALHLREWQPRRRRYTGRVVERIVTHKTAGGRWGLPRGLCVLSVRPRSAAEVVAAVPGAEFSRMVASIHGIRVEVTG